MTHFQGTDEVIVGSCFYTCRLGMNTPYYPVPSNPSSLSEATCGPYRSRREGQLCGKCKPGYSQPVYSYSMRCVLCSDDGVANRSLMYFAAAFLPLTVFLLVVLALRINVASARLNAFVTVCQLGLLAPHCRAIVAAMENGELSNIYPIIALALTVLGIWNLDFFRVFTSFCIHPHITTLQVIALDYIPAVYPLVLIIIVYVLVELHDRHIGPIAWLWRPFWRCLARFRRQWNIRSSLLSAFVTFFLLSTVKLLNVSMELLVPITLHNACGHQVGKRYLFSDGSVEYFGDEHRKYAILAIAVLVVFIFIPIVFLLIYPCRCFHWCLNCCGLRCQLLHMVMDIFQGSFKNGSSGTRDCKYFAVVYPILRVLTLVLFAITRTSFVYPATAATVIVTAMLVAIIRPYRNPVYNSLDIFLLLSLALINTSEYARVTISTTPYYVLPSELMTGVSAFILPVYGIALLVYWSAYHKRLPQAVLRVLTSTLRWFGNRRLLSQLDSSLPHRLLHAKDYDRAPESVEDGGECMDSSQLLDRYASGRTYGAV